jgi:hypothetical protein
MSRGITITNYLVDGNPEGIILSFMSNWTGKAVKIPRNLFSETKKFKELNRPGIYYLIGQNEENPDETSVYIGEANHLYERISQHMKDEKKSFFELIIAFSSIDDNLTVSHTKYLEAKVLKETIEKAGYNIINKKDGNRINLPKMVEDEMDTYFDNMKILMPVLGFDFFKPRNKAVKLSSKDKDDKLYLKVKNISASAKLIPNGLMVLKGSLMNKNSTSSLAEKYRNIREDLKNKGYIKEIDKVLEFIHDYEFSSPSQAGAVILGYSVNGRVFWKNIKGKTLKDIQKEKLEIAEDADYIPTY